MSYNSLFGLGTHSEDASLEGWWKLQDDAANTTIDDSSSNARDATLQGGDNTADISTTGPGGHLSKALNLDGTSDYYTAASSPFNISPSLTYFGRVYFDSLANNQWFADKSDTGQNKRAWRFYYNSGSSSVESFVSESGTATGDNLYYEYNGTISASTWYDVALVIDLSETGTDRAKFYLDGSEQTVSVNNINDAVTSIFSNDVPQAFGASRVSGSYGGYFNGRRAEDCIFSRACTASEINEIGDGPEPLNTVAPSVSGDTAVGSTLSCSTGTWDSQFNGLLSYSYQWTRDGSDISGATSSTYTTVSADVGSAIACKVLASNDGGSDSAEETASSNSITVVETGSTTDGAESGDTVTADKTVPGAVSDGAESSDTFSAVFTISGSVSDGAESGDTFESIDNSGDTTDGAESGDTFGAVATFLVDVGDGADSGDTFIAGQTMSGGVEDGASAGDTLLGGKAFGGSVSEGAQPGDSFSGFAFSNVESNLSIQYSDLQRAVARFLGWDRDPNNWSADQDSDFECILKSGLRRFYFPPAIEDEPSHGWTFLRTTATLNLSDGVWEYDLPDDFSGQLTTHFTFSEGSGQTKIIEIDEEQLYALRAKDSSAEAAPKYYALTIVEQSPTDGTRWGVAFYPTPDTSYSVSFEYEILPDTLDSTNKYPVGGAVHSETILEAVLAAAEEAIDDSIGLHNKRFIECLIGSIRKDKENTRRQADSTWEVSNAPTDLQIDYQYLRRVIGGFMEFGNNPANFDFTQSNIVDEIIRQGLRQFYHPFPIDGRRQSHEWSFMRPWGEITTSASVTTGNITIASGVVTITGGTFPTWAADGELDIEGGSYEVASYDSSTQITLEDTSISGTYSQGDWTLGRTKHDLPAGFTAIDGPMYYSPGETAAWSPIDIVSEHNIRQARQWGDWHGMPTMAAISPKPFDPTQGTRYQISFWPLPDDEYDFQYRYRISPSLLDATDKYPWGGMPHSQTVLFSCLAAAEMMKSKRRGGIYKKFRECLLTSIAFDVQAITPERLGSDFDNDGRYSVYLGDLEHFNSSRRADP